MCRTLVEDQPELTEGRWQSTEVYISDTDVVVALKRAHAYLTIDCWPRPL